MSKTLAGISPLLLLAGLASPGVLEHAAQELPIVVEGDHFRIHCHFDSQRAADEALASVEALFPAVDELYGETSREVRSVHLYRNAADYQAAEKKLTNGQFARNLAFAHYGSLSAHVALQPPVADAVLERYGLPQLTRELLAHEAAHLARYDSFRNFRSHPRWFVDGAADWLDDRALQSLGVDTSPSVDPESATTVFRVQELDEPPSAEAALSTPLESLPFYQGYAARELWFQFLMAEEPRRTREIIDEIRSRGGSNEEKFTKATFDGAKKAFGSRFKGLDKRFGKWLGEREPAWQQVYRSLERRDEDGEVVWLQAAFDTSNAIAWRTEPVDSKRFKVSGELEILPGQRQQMNLLLGRGDRGFVSIALVGGFGVTVFDYVSASNDWNQLANVEVDGVQVGQPFSFEVEVKGSALTIRIDGEEVVEIDDAKHDLRGPWGLGAQSSSAGVWRKLRAPGLD